MDANTLANIKTSTSRQHQVFISTRGGQGASAGKPRQPRLRASCDGCFLAKVKCSKTKPICSRCLACRIKCIYSPQSRDGKSNESTHYSNLSVPRKEGRSPTPDDKNAILLTQPASIPEIRKLESGWRTLSSMNSDMSRNHSMSSGFVLPEVEKRPNPWMAGGLYNYGSAQIPALTSMPPNYFPSPSATPESQASSPHWLSLRAAAGSYSSCSCFIICLQSIQALHNASSVVSPPLDLVLSLSRNAVEGAAAMLACPRCMSQSGIPTATMLLATIIGQVKSFYKKATQLCFESGGMSRMSPNTIIGSGIRIGAYHIDGEDSPWLDLEILARGLRKLEELYKEFREFCGGLSEGQEMFQAIIGFLDNCVSEQDSLKVTTDWQIFHRSRFSLFIRIQY